MLLTSRISIAMLVLSCYIYPMSSFAQGGNNDTASKEMVIAQMNYCINSLSNIIHNKSMEVLDHETDMLLNNLTIEHVSNLYDVVSFRSELVDKLGDLKITEEERNILKRVNEMKRSALMWQSLSSALSQTLLLVPGGMPGGMPGGIGGLINIAGGSVGAEAQAIASAVEGARIATQIAFMTALTAARSMVEYKSAQNEQNIGELQALWELRKNDLRDYIDLRKSAIDLEYKLYSKYHLAESDRLTESTALTFQQICSEPDAQKRLRLLENNEETYGHLLEYPYFVGMAYVDLGKYEEAKPYFSDYLQRYKKTPIFRYDEKSGCIALAMLTYDTTLSTDESMDLINKVLKNLPNVGAAAITCILKYIELDMPQNAYMLLCSSIDSPDMDNKDLMVMMASRLITDIKKYPSIYQSIESAIANTNLLDLNGLLAYSIADNPIAFFDECKNYISFNKVYDHPWYHFGGIWGKPRIKKSFQLNIPSKYLFNIRDIYVYVESVEDGTTVIHQYAQSYKDGIPLKKIYKKGCFKSNPNLLYLFMDPLIDGEYYIVKQGLDYSKIQSGEFPGLSEYTLTDSDLKDIVKFCKKKALKDPSTYLITSKRIKTKGEEVHTELSVPNVLTANLDTMQNSSNLFVSGNCDIEFYGDTITFVPYLLKTNPKNLIKVVFDGMNKVVLSFVWDEDNPNEVNLFSVEINGVIYFGDVAELINNIPAEESVEEEAVQEEKESWWQRVKSWFSSGKKEATKEDEVVTEDKADESVADVPQKKWYQKLLFWKKD